MSPSFGFADIDPEAEAEVDIEGIADGNVDAAALEADAAVSPDIDGIAEGNVEAGAMVLADEADDLAADAEFDDFGAGAGVPPCWSHATSTTADAAMTVRMGRTRIRDLLKRPVNFAGR